MSSSLRPKRASRQKNSPKSSRNDQQRRSHRNTLTCNNCRARKTKCDGTQPGCKTCEVYNDQCRYEKPPPMSQIIAMSQRLQEYEQIIETLRAREKTSRSTASPAMHWDDTRSQSQSQSEHELGTSSVTVYQSSKNGLDSDNPGPVLISAERLSDLSLDENGKLCYYGPTSAVHDPPTIQGQDVASSSTNLISKADVHNTLVSGAMESRVWEDFALGNATIEMGLPRETVSKLLQLHWSWIAPLFMWVYRPAFMRDMITGGQYFSQFLLVVLCAHSSRFQDSSVGEILISRARLLLGQEIQKPSSIPTVQALLQLSARELAYGSISQAWLYSGMAFRMVSDLGLHRASENVARLGRLTAEDLEIRRRLFWSCYFWDKAISLYLGRLPALTELPLGHEPKLFDDSTADDLWAPYYGDAVIDNSNPQDAYPPMKSHAVSCFENSCKLAVIMNQIILQLYSRGALSATDSTLQAIREQLDDWRTNSPEYLRYDPDNLEGVCCPPHILTQNLLYYTTIILLHRPFSSSPIHYAACRQAASSIEKLLLFHERSFGFTRITYLMAYCIYTGASTIIPDVNLGDVAARASMNTFLRALKGGCTTCPVVQRSINIIMNSLQEHGAAMNNDTVTQLSAHSAIDDNTTASFARNYPPAFPHNDWQLGTGFDQVGSSSLMDSDALFLLECFPENHIDAGVSEWYMP